MSRPIALAGLATLCACLCPAQDVFLTSKPDVFIVARKSNVGAHYMTLQPVQEDYPPDLLRSQCVAIGKNLGGEIRGLETSYRFVSSADGSRKGKILYARFAVDNLTGPEPGRFNMLPVVKALAAVPEPNTIDVISFTIAGEAPVAGVSLQRYDGPTAAFVAHFDSEVPQGDEKPVPQVQYIVTLKTQDPAKIWFPQTAAEQTKPAEKPSNQRFPAELLYIAAGAAVLVGVLVYFALRPSRRSGSAQGTRNPK